MKIVSVPNKEQTTYYCDKCKKILKKDKSVHFLYEDYDHIQERISYDKTFVNIKCYSEKEEIISKEDLCNKCYWKKQKKYDRLVKSKTRAERIRHKIIQFSSFKSPVLLVDIKIGSVRIKWKYARCRCGLCLRNGKDNIIVRNGKSFYYCDKHHKMIVDLLINPDSTNVKRYLMHK